MAIEPLNTVMTLQVQPAVKSTPVVDEHNSTMEGQSISSDAPKVDDRIISVDKTNNDSDQNQGEEKEQGESFNQELMRQAMQEINKKAANVEAEFGIHEKTNRITIKIVDKQTKEVIKELPPEKMLDMVARIWETAGLVVDEKR